MVQASRRTTVRGPTFARLLARLTDVDIPPSSQSLSDQLSQWLDWTQAIALSTALDGKPSADAAGAPAEGGTEADECARARAALTQTIANDRELAAAVQREVERAVAEQTCANEAIDYTIFRQRYLELQRKMLMATGALRGRLRDRLAQAQGMAQLAAVDAAMELALSAREQRLLAAVPDLLGTHFARLRRAEQKARADSQGTENIPAAAPGAWLDVFRKDMQSVLLAELDVRFQPVEGLLAALRTRQLECHV